MTPRLQKEIVQQRPFGSVEEEAFLNLQRTAAVLMQAFSAVLKPLGLTPTQYNVLRILRGARPDGLPCKEVGRRLVTPVPDVTRLLDRMEKRSLVSRGRGAADRRVVEVRIAADGLTQLERSDEPVRSWVGASMGRLSTKELERFVRLAERLRT